MTPEVRRQTYIRASPEEVYDALATADGLDSWFTSGATVDPRPGGEITYRWVDWGPRRISTTAPGTVHEAVRPSRFVFERDSGDEHPTTVEFDLEARDGRTVLHLREHGFSSGDRGMRAALDEASGWGEAMTLVKFRIEHGLRY
ncbi:MAG TPA: SRPBCC domain-containing protein [Candidatus Limnocylindria bacterium]|nr:SRPBCC domain-containing protein [Candidatus Limnocylindria bacterium]